MFIEKNVKQLEEKLQVVINRLIHLQNMVGEIDEAKPTDSVELNDIYVASSDVCEAYIDVLRAVGISDDTLQKLGFDNPHNIKKIEITSFLDSLNSLLRSDICDKQRAVLVNGANHTHNLLNARNTLKNSKSPIIFKTKLTGFELFITFAIGALIGASKLAAVGYIIDGINGAKVGAALGIFFMSPEVYKTVKESELAQAKYTLARSIKIFYDNMHAYKYDMHPKDLLGKKDSLDVTLESTFEPRPLSMSP